MTLDNAIEAFEANPSKTNAEILGATAREYADDGMISESEACYLISLTITP